MLATVAIFGIARLQGDPTYTDPFGYIIHSVPGNSEYMMPLQLAKWVSFKESVTEVTAAGIRFAKPIPAGALGIAGLGIMEVREGNMAGLAIPATGISGNFLTLERSPLGLVSVGDYASIREDQTLGDIFGPPESIPFQTGTSAEEADTVSIWDARTQISRIFYFHTDLGWREANKANEGDKSSTPVRFPSGVIIRRRAETPVDVFVQGSVIVPFEQRFHPVWPGRNIISAPFTNAPTIGFYIRPLLDAPHTVTSASSAPRADTLRFYSLDGINSTAISISPVLYFRNSQWCVVGSIEDAGNTSINFIPCLDLQRVGSAGYIRFQGPIESQAGQSLAALPPVDAVTEIKPVTLTGSAGDLTVRWPAEPGTTYQVQTRPMEATAWTNLEGAVVADSSTASLHFTPSGNRCIRVIKP